MLTQKQKQVMDFLKDSLSQLRDMRSNPTPGTIDFHFEKLGRLQKRISKRLNEFLPKEAENYDDRVFGTLAIGDQWGNFDSRLLDLIAYLDNLILEIENYPEDFFESNEQNSSGSTPALGVDELKSFHPEVIKTAGRLFQDGHYRQAVLDTYIGLVEAVKIKSGRFNIDGTGLMTEVFSAKSPILKVSDSPDEQKGFMWLFSGAVMGIRNPKAHSLIPQEDPQRALEWLSFASVLFRVLEDAELVEGK